MDRVVDTPQTIESVPTPALILDQATIERNIQRLADYGRRHNLAIRPHTKTHKSREMARRQLAAGAAGLTTAKVGEAEIMAQESRDILIAYPTVDAARARGVAAISKRNVRIRVALDSAYGLDALEQAAKDSETTIGVLVDLDVGFHRTGVQSPQAALELARAISKRASLRLDGLFCYPGHLWSPAAEQTGELMRIDGLLKETIELWRRDGLEAPIVSGGSTPTAFQSHQISSLTENRPGTYIYNDMNTVRAGFCELEDCGASIICTVVSTAVPGKAVLDAGTKTLTSDRNAKAPDSGHGHVIEYPQAKLVRLSEEHGEMDISKCEKPPRVGDRVTVIPNHICPCVNLQDLAWLHRKDGSLEVLTIDARGELS